MIGGKGQGGPSKVEAWLKATLGHMRVLGWVVVAIVVLGGSRFATLGPLMVIVAVVGVFEVTLMVWQSMRMDRRLRDMALPRAGRRA
jgi:hypothetical protein